MSTSGEGRASALRKLRKIAAAGVSDEERAVWLANKSSPELVSVIAHCLYHGGIEPSKTEKPSSEKAGKKKRGWFSLKWMKGGSTLTSSKSEDLKKKKFDLPSDLAGLIHRFLFYCVRKISEFEFAKELDLSGSMTRMYIAKDSHNEGKWCILKALVIHQVLERHRVTQSMDELRIYKEMNQSSTAKCPWLLRLHYAFRSTRGLYFVFDFQSGGTLFHHLRKHRWFDEPSACVMIAELSAAVMHLHSKLDIIHRDLKPEHIWLDSRGHCVLHGFDSARQLTDGSLTTKTFCGTPEYIAPEIIAGVAYGKSVDWWTIGILLYELCVGIPPFYDQNIHQMYRKIQESPLLFPSALSAVTKDLITRLLIRDVKTRLGSGSIIDLKSHPFWTEVGPGSLESSDDFWSRLCRLEIDPPFKPPTHSTDPLANYARHFAYEKHIVADFDPILDFRNVQRPRNDSYPIIRRDKPAWEEFEDLSDGPFEHF